MGFPAMVSDHVSRAMAGTGSEGPARPTAGTARSDPPSTTGVTDERHVVVFGDPVAQARIVTHFNVAFESLGIAALAIPRSTRRVDAEQAIHVFSDPLVVAACSAEPMELSGQLPADSVDPDALLAGAISALRRDGASPRGVRASLFDGVGFVRHLGQCGFEPAGARVLLTGYPLEAASIAVTLASHGVASIEIDHWDIAATEALSRRLMARYPVRCSPPALTQHDYDLVVFHADRLAAMDRLSRSQFRPGLWLADTSLSSHSGPLLRRAESAGARTFAGASFLKSQISLYLEFFLPALPVRADSAV